MRQYVRTYFGNINKKRGKSIIYKIPGIAQGGEKPGYKDEASRRSFRFVSIVFRRRTQSGQENIFNLILVSAEQKNRAHFSRNNASIPAKVVSACHACLCARGGRDNMKASGC